MIAMNTFDVDGIRAEPGGRAFGHVKVGETPFSDVSFPLSIIRSTRNGPVLLVTAGIHPSEYPGIEAAMRLMNTTQPTDLKKGTLIVIPVVNTLGFDTAAVNTSPIDNINLNRIFPGTPGGTMSHRLAQKLVEVATRIDYLVDLHGGDATESLRPLTIYHKTGHAEADTVSAQMARLFDTEFIWDMEEVFFGGSLLETVARMGKPAVISEAGKLGTYEEGDVQSHLHGIENVMRLLGFKEGKPAVAPRATQKVLSRSWNAGCERGGIVYPSVGVGEKVVRGQLLAQIRNIHGEVLEEVCAPDAGWIRVHFPRRVANSGTLLFRAWVATEDGQSAH